MVRSQRFRNKHDEVVIPSGTHAGGGRQVVDVLAQVPSVGWRHYALTTAAVGLFSTLLIVGSYSRLNHTWDEPTHIAT